MDGPLCIFALTLITFFVVRNSFFVLEFDASFILTTDPFPKKETQIKTLFLSGNNEACLPFFNILDPKYITSDALYFLVNTVVTQYCVY